MKFSNAKSIDKNVLKNELIVCLQPVIGKLKSRGIHLGVSMNKRDIVTQLSNILGDGSELERRSRKPQKSKKVETLRMSCKKVVQQYSKLVLNSIYAEVIYAQRLEEFYNSSPYGATINIVDQDIYNGQKWYSKPEFNSVVGHYMFLVLDSYHQICGARRLVCQNGIPSAGVKKEAFHKIAKDAKDNGCGLNMAMAIDLIDKQICRCP